MSTETDFQNGFLCGMATKGLIRSGALYAPIIWNDEGVYDFFYIDFKRALAPFSMGMLDESLILHDSVQFDISNFTYVSPGVYKIYCDLSDKIKGVTVMNKVSTLLSFSDGTPLPVFSTLFYVAGLVRYNRLPYCYDSAPYVTRTGSADPVITESWGVVEGIGYDGMMIPLESAMWNNKGVLGAITENVTLVLT